MNKLFFLSIICFLILCGCEKKKQTDYTVKNTGALMNIMSGNLVATASLDSIQKLPHLYALGALENLKGEVQVFD
ncbi:MAG: decarboxylase, partial [Nonlabens ulvanivorans]